MAPDEKTFCVYNLFDGVDVYSFPDLVLQRSIKTPSSHHYVKQIVFAKDFTLLVQGSEIGKLYVADISTGAILEVLTHSRSWYLVFWFGGS